MSVNMNTDVEMLTPLQATPSPTTIHMVESNVSEFGNHSELPETTSR